MVIVLMNGRPLTINWLDENVPAIVEAWFLGTQAGNAIADVLFGDYNPSGKLPVTFPRSVGQIPIFYSMKNTGRPMDPANKYTSKYLDESNEPLYPFGYGLSYTSFKYDQLTLSQSRMSQSDKLIISCRITNTGKYAGEEVVQLYIRDKVGSVTRPVKELKGFKKISLNPGESQQVEFSITNADLSFYRRDMSYGSEPGEFEVFVGGNSRDVIGGSFLLE
jgi:beta-glucosidase